MAIIKAEDIMSRRMFAFDLSATIYNLSDRMRMFYFRMWRLDVVLSNMAVKEKSEWYEQFLWMQIKKEWLMLHLTGRTNKGIAGKKDIKEITCTQLDIAFLLYSSHNSVTS